jgi:cytosine/adenosine deaminase-related metal-dependent hydrolase
MATREGAHALNMEHEIGAIEVGKRADLILVCRDGAHVSPDRDPWSSLVYACRGSDVRLTMVDGEIVSRAGQLAWAERSELAAEARGAAAELVGRAGI